jgi:hypothetical protein
MTIITVGAELLHVDRRTDRHEEANSRFSQFCKCTYKVMIKHQYRARGLMFLCQGPLRQSGDTYGPPPAKKIVYKCKNKITMYISVTQRTVQTVLLWELVVVRWRLCNVKQ